MRTISPVARTWGVLATTLVVLASVVAFDAQESAAIAPINELNVTRLVPTDEIGPQFFDQFGTSVSVCGETAVVGSPGTGFSEFGVGTARVFEFNGTGWGLAQTLFEGEPEALFGASVAISGKTLVVGAPGALLDTGIVPNPVEINETIPAGLVFVYERREESIDRLTTDAATQWQLVDVLSSPDPYPGQRFGASVAVSGDHVVVGADPELFLGELDVGGYESPGAAYVYRRNATPPGPVPVAEGDVWEFLQELLPAASGGDGEGYYFAFESFGRSVAIHGRTIAVGAPVSEGFGPAEFSYLPTGSVYLFQLRQGLFAPTVQLSPEDQFDDYGLPGFGTSVDLAGRTVVVGAPMNGGVEYYGVDVHTFNETSGRVYVFEATGTWHQTGLLAPWQDDAGANPGYGTSVAISSDSGDVIVVGSPGSPEFLQGAPQEFFGSAAHIYERASRDGETLFNNTHIVGFPFNEFGTAVDTTSLFTCVGSPFWEDFGSGHGAAHVFRHFSHPTAPDSTLQIRRAFVRGRVGAEQLFVSGILDVGKPDFSQPAVIGVLEDEHEFSGFREIERRAGNSLFVARDPFRVSLLTSRFGSSNTRFTLRVPGFRPPGSQFELPISFNGTTAAVVMNEKSFSRYSRRYPGSQLAPDFGVDFLRGRLTGKKQDRLVLRGKLATDGTMPEELPCLVVAIGDTFRQVIEPGRLRRGPTGVFFSQGRRPGVALLRYSYLTGNFLISLRDVNLGCPSPDPVQMQVTFGDCDSPESVILCVGSRGDRIYY